MKVTLIGYGRMGKLIEQILTEQGHEIITTIDNDKEWEEHFDQFLQSDVAIEFSTPQTVIANMERCFANHVPVVVGTTGWQDQREEMICKCKAAGSSMVFGSNFSIGANLFFTINEIFAQMMNAQPQYNVAVEETHHITKKDAPSGTAITTAQIILDQLTRKNNWKLNGTADDEIGITAHRVGDTAGIHKVTYTCDEDFIEIAHTANGRVGFAKGAVKAAQWLCINPGVYDIKEIFGKL